MKVKQSDDLLELLSKGGEFKFKIIETGSYSSSSYSFKIDNSSGFSNAYAQLIK